MDGILAISTILLAGMWMSERIKRWREDDRKAQVEQDYQDAVAVKYPRSEIGPLPESPRYDDAVPYNWITAAGKARTAQLKNEVKLMTNEGTHTPLPWHIENEPGDLGLPGSVHIFGDGKEVCSIEYTTPYWYCVGASRSDIADYERAQSDAALIVTAVNSYAQHLAHAGAGPDYPLKDTGIKFRIRPE